MVKPGALFPGWDDDDEELQRPEPMAGARPGGARLGVPGAVAPIVPGPGDRVRLQVAALPSGWSGARHALIAELVRRWVEGQGLFVDLALDDLASLTEAHRALIGAGLAPTARPAAPPQAAVVPLGAALPGVPCAEVAPIEGAAPAFEEALAAFGAEVVRAALLAAAPHAAHTIDADALEAAHDRLEYLYGALQRANDAIARVDTIPERGGLIAPVGEHLHTFFDELHAALAAGLDTPAALEVIGRMARASGEAARGRRGAERDVAYTQAAARACIVQGAQVLALLQRFPDVALKELRTLRCRRSGEDAAAIDAALKERGEARAAKDWGRADALRAELERRGVEVMDADGAGGTPRWRLIRRQATNHMER